MSKGKLFAGGLNRVIYQNEDKVVLLDVSTNKQVGQLQSQQRLKQVVWNDKRTLAVLLFKKQVVVVNKDLVKLYQVSEKNNLKSAIFTHND